MKLTSKQRAHLRKLAHHLKPVVLVGNDGVTDTLVESVREAFNSRELLKVKVQEAAPEPARRSADEIAAALEGVHAVHVIGRTAVLYRPFPEHPEIRLPG